MDNDIAKNLIFSFFFEENLSFSLMERYNFSFFSTRPRAFEPRNSLSKSQTM